MKCKRPKCPKTAGERTTGFCQGHYRAYLKSRASATGRRLGYVDPQPTLDHIARLRAAGLTLARIGLLTGVDRRNLTRMPSQKSINGATEAKVLAIPVPGEVHSISADSAKIDATGTRRRLQALAAIGYHYEAVADTLEMDHTNIWRLATGYKPLVCAWVARDVDALFRRLQLTPAPDSQGAAKAIKRAKRNGWPTPLAWNEEEIDNPDAKPHLPDDNPDWLDTYEELLDMGIAPEFAAERLGIKWRTVQRRLERMKAA